MGTKAFALRGTLLDAGAIQKLTDSTSLEEFVNRLRSTPYSDVLSSLSPPYSARRIELALRERQAVVHHSVAQSGGRFPILQLYYLKNIAWNLKLVLKAKVLGRPYEETVEYIDMKAEELVGRRDLIIRVLSAKDINEAVAMLSGSEFSADVEKALSAFTASGEIRFFDLYIDHVALSAISREYYRNSKLYVKSPDVNGVGDLVKVDVDGYNVVSILRAKLWGLRESEIRDMIVTPAKRVPAPTLLSMAGADSVGEAVKLIEPAYQFLLRGAQNDEELADMVEDGFARKQKETATMAFVWQGLSPGTALAFIKLLEFEVGNLAAIAAGIEAGMEPRQILSRLRT
jgi:V/A-type H+-transporting ATPase subunit C